jgi:hypothetical protein
MRHGQIWVLLKEEISAKRSVATTKPPFMVLVNLEFIYLRGQDTGTDK